MVETRAAPAITVAGNVEGSIVIGDHNFVVNTNHGTIVYRQAGPQVKARDVKPQPPRAPRGLVGRTTEIARLEQVLATRMAAVVVGADGLGKSTLLKRVAHSQAARGLSHGCVFLEGVDEHGQALGPTDVVQRLFDALFESDPPLKVTTASARTYLSNTQPLVLLDHLNLPASFLEQLPDLIPNGAWLLTAARPLAGDAFTPLKLTPLARAEAVELLAGRAGLAATAENRPALEALCASLGDCPLALVMTAAVMGEYGLSLEAAQQRLAAQPTVTAADPLQNALDRAYGLAFSALSAEERQMLLAAIAAPGVSVDAAWLKQTVGGVAWTEAALERLKRLGLLTPNSPRLRLAPGLRDVMGLDAPTDVALKAQLIRYLTERLNQRPPDFAFAEDELGNALGLLDWAGRTGRQTEVLALGRALDPYLTLRGTWDAWRVTLESVLRAARAQNDPASEAWALHQLGTREIGVGTRESAIELLQQALKQRRALGDGAGAAHTQHNLNLLLPPPPPPRSEPRPPGGGRGVLTPELILLAAVGVIIVAAAVILGGFLLAGTQTAPPATIAPTTAATAAAPTPIGATPAPTQPTVATPAQTESPPTAPPTDAPTPLPLPSKILFYTNREGDGNLHLFAMNRDGSQPTRLLTAASLSLGQIGCSGLPRPSLSPDGARVLIRSMAEGGYFVANADGSNLTRVDSGPPGPDSFGLWSPDGAYVVLPSTRDQRTDLDTADREGAQATALTSGLTFNSTAPQWLPDGRRLLFEAYTLGDIFVSNGLYRIAVDGSDLTALTGENTSAATLLPDGERFVFLSRNAAGPVNLELMDINGAGRLALTSFTDATVRVGSVQPAPDGQRVFFIVSGADERTTLQVVNVDGSGLQEVTPDLNVTVWPAWSPDGQRALLAAGPIGAAQTLYLLDAASSTLTPLRDGLAFATGATWSPDGQRAVFGLGIGVRAQAELYLLNADGSGLTPLGLLPQSVPVWSPDSRQFAVSARLNNDAAQLAFVNADSLTVRTIEQLAIPGWSAANLSPLWEGTRLLFQSPTLDSGSMEIYAVNTDGSGLVNLTQSPADDYLVYPGGCG